MNSNQDEFETVVVSSAGETASPKSAGGFSDSVIATLLFSIWLLFGGSLLAGILTTPVILALGASDRLVFILNYAAFAGYWILGLLYLRKAKYRPFLKKLGAASGNTVGRTLSGALTGFGMNGLCILCAWLHGDIHLRLEPDGIGVLLLLVVFVCIQSGAEELICRLFCYQKLKRRYRSELVAVIFPALFFAGFHLSNPGVTALGIFNILLTGLFYGLIIYYFDALWFCILNHTLWNYTQSILFGLPNSGIVSEVSVFRLDASVATDSFFYSVSFGVESSLMASLVILAAIGLTVVFGRKARAERLAAEQG